MSRRALLLLTAAPLFGCGSESPPAPAPRAAPSTALELGPVVTAHLARLDAKLAGDNAPTAAPVDGEHVRGLAAMVGGGGNMHALALVEARDLGPGAIPELTRLAADEAAADADRSGAIEILATVDTTAAGETLLTLLETGSPAWVRAHAAWRLSTTTQDWVVPRAILRLKYERDHETVVWMGRLLARFANYAGVRGLSAIAADPISPQRAAASGSLSQLLADAGVASLPELELAWINGDPDGKLPTYEHSPRFERELWRRVARLDEFQLRGVDDARFVLERCGGHAAKTIAAALRDESLYIRVHVAQSLERMGPHAAPAGPALIEALADPDLAPNACAALGGVQYEPAGPDLLALLARDTDLDLRLAATRALGRFGDKAPPDAAAALGQLTDASEPLEIRQAAAESLLALGDGEAQLGFLVGLLTERRLDPKTTRDALRTWLAERAATGPEEARTLLASWDALDLPTDKIVPTADRRAAQEARQRLLVAALGL